MSDIFLHKVCIADCEGVMSFCERTLVSLVVNVLVFGLLPGLRARWTARAASGDHGLGRRRGDLICAGGAVHRHGGDGHAQRAQTRAWRPLDERERLIRLRHNITSAVVTAGVIAVMSVLLMGWNAVLAANLLLAVLVNRRKSSRRFTPSARNSGRPPNADRNEIRQLRFERNEMTCKPSWRRASA